MKVLLFISIVASYVLANVGEIVAMSGNVVVLRGTNSLNGSNGFKLENKDVVKTLENGQAQLLFQDESVIRVGKSSTFEIENYLFDNSENSEAKFKVSSGFFKAVTGKISKVAKQNFELKTNSATCGIRGTHFAGSISKEREKIVCLKGAITVTANGKTVDVIEGEMTEFKAGLVPSIPVKFKKDDIEKIEKGFKLDEKVTKLIQSVKLTKDLSVDKDKLKEVFEALKEIKDNDLVLNALNKLENSLNEQYEQFLEASNKKADVSNLLNVQAIESDKYSPIKFGFYVKDELGIDYNNLSKADMTNFTQDKYGNLEMYRTSILESQASDVAKKMGYDEINQKVYEFWDGNSKGRVVSFYDGVVAGSVKYNSQYSLIDSTNSKVNLMFDMGNRLLLGNIGYLVNNRYYNTTDEWVLYFANVGKNAISPTGYMIDENQFYSNFTPAVSDAFFYDRFFGSNLEQVSSYFQLTDNKNENFSENFDEIAYGMFVANKSKEIEMVAKQIGANDYFSYGYWAENSFDSSNLQSNTYGGWVKAFEGVSQTKEDVIKNFIANGAKATYHGDIIGSVYNLFEAQKTSVIHEGVVNLNFDFANANLNGDMNFKNSNNVWDIKVYSGKVETAGFSFDKFSGTVSDGQTIDNFSGNGKFFGSTAQAIAGGFNAGTDSGNIAVGAFSGFKK
ncbi:MAG: FecR domain-containing protein [Campylobacterales bacterium]|nr:FecR domain-containing protein [Campylobacterales bacterium]